MFTEHLLCARCWANPGPGEVRQVPDPTGAEEGSQTVVTGHREERQDT